MLYTHKYIPTHGNTYNKRLRGMCPFRILIWVRKGETGLSRHHPHWSSFSTDSPLFRLQDAHILSAETHRSCKLGRMCLLFSYSRWHHSTSAVYISKQPLCTIWSRRCCTFKWERPSNSLRSISRVYDLGRVMSVDSSGQFRWCLRDILPHIAIYDIHDSAPELWSTWRRTNGKSAKNNDLHGASM